MTAQQLRDRALDNLETILLSAGISFPQSSAPEWQAAREGANLPSFERLGLDSLGLNELSISLELVSGIELTTAEIFEMKSLEDLVEILIEKDRSFDSPASKIRTPNRVSFRNRVTNNLHLYFREIAGSLTAESIFNVSRLPLEWLAGFSQVTEVSKNLRIYGTGKVVWSRRYLKSDALIYKAKGRLPGSVPLVVFGGAWRRPGMPVSYFLKGVEKFTDTVVLLRTRHGDGFRSGIRGLGKDLPKSFEALVPKIHAELSFEGDFVAPLLIGVSTGGLPALIFSSYIPLQGALLIGPHSTKDSRWVDSPELREALKKRKSGNSCHVRIGYGEIGEDNLRVHYWVADIANSSIFSIPNADHNALFPLFVRGDLDGVLRLTLASRKND